MCDSNRRWRITRIFLTTLYLLVGWVLFSGTLQPRNLLVGTCFCFLVSLLTYDVFIDRTEAHRRALIPQLHWGVVYIGYIIFRVYLASFRVLFLVLRREINPRVVHFRTRLRSDLARVVLANSLTITPGTIALDLDDDHLLVHWLDSRTTHSRYAGEIIKGDMERILKRILV